MSTNNEAIADQLREWAKQLSDPRPSGSGALGRVIQGMKEVADNLAEQSVREKWDVAVKSLTDELARLDLEVLVADSIEDYCLTDGYYQIMLRYDDVVSLRKTLNGLSPGGSSPSLLPSCLHREEGCILFEEDE